jgi:sulfatase maturation enzyme AslB (radical SAM superfamily)
MIDLNTNKAFCILPFVHLHVNEKSDIKLCCLADGKTVKKYTQDFDFVNDPDMQEIRQRILAGEKVEHCRNCYDYEEGGAESSRIRDTREWQQKLGFETADQVPTRLVYYDIRNDNLCNLSCRMCSPQFSSQIEKEYKKIGWMWQAEDKSVGFNDVVDLDTVEKIYVAGGEPSLMPEFRRFLVRAIDAGRTNIEIRMNTNATNLNREYRELLSRFDSLNIVCSIDGYDMVNRYIRWPTDWPTLVENMHGISAITPNLAFNVTVSIWNISRLSELIEFFDREFPNNEVLINQVYGPSHWLFTTFPNTELALADLERCKASPRYQTESFRNKLDWFIEQVKSSQVDLVALDEFFKYNDTLDSSRNIKLKDYIPELEACRDYLTKQI